MYSDEELRFLGNSVNAVESSRAENLVADDVLKVASKRREAAAKKKANATETLRIANELLQMSCPRRGGCRYNPVLRRRGVIKGRAHSSHRCRKWSTRYRATT